MYFIGAHTTCFVPSTTAQIADPWCQSVGIILQRYRPFRIVVITDHCRIIITPPPRRPDTSLNKTVRYTNVQVQNEFRPRLINWRPGGSAHVRKCTILHFRRRHHNNVRTSGKTADRSFRRRRVYKNIYSTIGTVLRKVAANTTRNRVWSRRFGREPTGPTDSRST